MKLMTILSACAAALLAGEAAATTLYVNKATGDDAAAKADTTRATRFRTIQAAVACAADGDTVSVAPGIYDEGGVYGDTTNTQKLTRVSISKQILLKAESNDPADTHIVGAPDTTETRAKDYGLGPNAVRCITAYGGPVIRGFTIRDGCGFATDNNSDSYAGGVAGIHKGWSDFYLCDCVVSNCCSERGAAVTGGTVFRTRMFNCYGTVHRWSRLANCLIDGTRSGPACSESTDYNCTLVNTGGYNLRAAAKINNAVLAYASDYASAGGDTGITITNSYATQWKNSATTPGTDCVWTNVNPAVDDTFFSPLSGDWHLVKGCAAQAIGEAELLAKIQVTAFATNTGYCNPFVDLDGVTIPTTGKIAPGCYQTLRDLTKTSGTFTFSESMIVDGYPQRTSTAKILRTVQLAQEVNLYPRSTSGEFNYLESSAFYRGVIFPQMDDTVWLMMPPSETNVAVKCARTTNIAYVNPDPAIGSDETGTGSSSAPYLSIAKAAKEKGSKAVIHCAPGVYTNGYRSFFGINTRVQALNYQRIKGAGIGKSIIMGQRATGTTGDDGRGADAMRTVGLSDYACIQGFTIKDGYTLTGTDSASNRYGGLCKGTHSPTTAQGQILDCLLSNGWAYRGAIGHGVTFMRCIFTGNNGNPGAGAQNQIRYGSVFSSLFYDNATTDGLLNTSDTPVTQVTLIGFGSTDSAALSKSIVTQNTLVYNIKQQGYQASGNGFFNGMTTDPKFATAFNAAYRLSKDSPALGAGVMPKWNMYCTDLEGKPFRYTNGKPTVGCYQNPGKAASLFQLQ